MRALQDSGPYAVAADMAQSIAVNVLSEQAENLTDPIFAALGISSASTDAAQYFAQIQTALTQIEGDLEKVIAKLATLSNQIDAVQNALTAISSQITDAELQSVLAQYAENANIIEQNYQTYAAAIAGMGNAATFEQGSSALFALFQPTNTDAVATAMRNIHDLLVGGGELRGIVSYQTLEIERAWNANAQYIPGITRSNAQSDPGDNSWNGYFPDGAMVLENLPQVLTTAFASPIIPTLKAAMAVQLKGLNFLCAAWGGTIYVSSLTEQTGNITDVVTAMKGLFAACDFDSLGAGVLQTSGPRLSNDALAGQYLAPDLNLVPCPFDTSYVMWNGGMIDPDLPADGWMPGVVRQPWTYGDLPVTYVSNDPIDGVEVPQGSNNFERVYYSYGNPVTQTIPRPSASGVTAPANLTAFLATLPAAS